MRGDAEVIELLNEVLTAELAAIDQYFLHGHTLDTGTGATLAAADPPNA
jgi:bacterioferritin (cytochrome b1)